MHRRVPQAARKEYKYNNSTKSDDNWSWYNVHIKAMAMVLGYSPDTF